MNDSIILIIVAVLAAANLYLLWRFSQGRRTAGVEGGMQLLLTQLNDLHRSMNERMSDFQRNVDSRITESSRTMHDSVRTQFSESAKIIRDVTERLTKLDETNRQVVGFAEQLQSLQDILKNPKQRGVLGEYYLETLLKNVLPAGSYAMQYEFSDGSIVDAVVFVRDKIIPIDSKFSLENYNRLAESKEPAVRDRLEKLFVSDLKNRIVETSKYIQPEQGTTEFAFMFIPHEAIYYDLLVNKVGAVSEENENLIQRAAGKYRVIIVSPTSFLAYLQTVLQGLKALEIEGTAKEIIKRVEELARHMKSYEEYHGKLGNALSTAVNQFNASNREFKKIDKDVVRISGQVVGIEARLLEKPDQAD